MTKYIFFSGKGGAGKTTMACATAIHHAAAGKRTLIITTDPASNLADVFEQEIGHNITPIQGIKNLCAMEIDPDEATREYKERIIGPFRKTMPEDVIASLEENLSGPCTTEIASFDRFVDFMENAEYDVIVFDTAPTGHTIRLLELPIDWSKHIEESAKGSGQTCLGPVQSIQKSKAKYDRATALLADPKMTTFVFVMRPEELSLYETLRASRELEAIGIRSEEIIINGILPEDVCEMEFFRKKYEAQQKVINKIESAIQKPKRLMLLRDNEVKGKDALIAVAAELYGGKIPARSVQGSKVKTGIAIEKPDVDHFFLPSETTKTIFFTGKGGVGKTTVSCITALHIARRGFKTLLVTTDPAAHIGEVFGVSVQNKPTPVTHNLYAVMVDQEEAFREYKERTLKESSGKYSEDILSAMEEELNSPCTQEMAAFDKFIRFIESKDYAAIVFDTAPTGHTLRLLSLPFDYARQAEMMISTEETAHANSATRNRFLDIIKILKDKNKAVFAFVLYPESTPILESYRAMLDLKDAGIEAQMVVSNMMLPDNACTNDFFKNRKRMQMKYLAEIKDKFNLPIIQLPLMQDEVRGLAQIEAAAKNL